MDMSFAAAFETVRSVCISKIERAKQAETHAIAFRKLHVLVESMREPEKLVANLQAEKVKIENEIAALIAKKQQQTNEVAALFHEATILTQEIATKKIELEVARDDIERGASVLRVLSELQAGGNAIKLGQELSRLLG